MSLYTDLLYRRIPQAVGIYLTAAWLGIEFSSAIVEAFELPKAATRLVILLSLAGFPVAMFVGWRYNFTPQGLERTPEKAGWFARFFLGVVLITAAAATAVIPRAGLVGPEATAQAVAVLALRADLVPGAHDDLGELMADEILLELTGLPGIKVAASTSSYALSKQDKDIRTLAEELNVRYVVEGSLHRGLNSLRAIVSIVDAQTGFCVWTSEFSRQVDEEAQLRADVASGVMHKMAGSIGLAVPSSGLSARAQADLPLEEG